MMPVLKKDPPTNMLCLFRMTLFSEFLPVKPRGRSIIITGVLQYCGAFIYSFVYEQWECNKILCQDMSCFLKYDNIPCWRESWQRAVKLVPVSDSTGFKWLALGLLDLRSTNPLFFGPYSCINGHRQVHLVSFGTGYRWLTFGRSRSMVMVTERSNTISGHSLEV